MNKLIQQAFTLIELLVVIAIIGILSGLIVVSMSGVTQKANIAKAQAFSNSLRNALMLNIVAQYSFDDIDSTDYDPSTKALNNDVGNIPDSWSSNEGQAYNGPIMKEGSNCVSGNCLSFDGTDDYVDCGTGLNSSYGTKQMTISLWLYNKNVGLIKSIITNRDSASIGNMFLYKNTNEKIIFDLYSTDSIRWITNYSVPINTWINLSLNFDGITTTLYIDGKYKDSTTTQSTATFPGTSIYGTFIGRDSQLSQYYWNGLMDDVRIYNAALPISQIKEQYYFGLNSLLTNGSMSKEEYLSRINNYASNN